MDGDPFIVDRLRLRRAALGQLSGIKPRALDELVEEHRNKVLLRLDEFPAEPNENTDEPEPTGP